MKFISFLVSFFFITLICLIFCCLPILNVPDFKNHNLAVIDQKTQKKAFIFRFDSSGEKKINDEKLNDQYFEILFGILEKANLIKPGEFALYENEKLFMLLRRIFENKRYARKLYIPSGANKFSLLAILNNAPKLFGPDVKFDDFEEGELFPDTYHYFYGEKRQNLVEIMKKRTEKLLSQFWNQKRPDLPYKTPKEALILASIVEKEAYLESDKPLIVSVFLNRLKTGMKLQADPTAQYANKLKNYERELKGLPKEKFDLMTNSPYNTYFSPGLPPAPICNVSFSSLNAVFNSEKTDFLYFISFPGEKKFIFSKTYAEHNRHVLTLRKKQKEIKK